MGEEKREDLMHSLFGAGPEESEDEGRGSYSEEGEGEVDGEGDAESGKEESEGSEVGGEEGSAASGSGRENEAHSDQQQRGAKVREPLGESDEEEQEEVDGPRARTNEDSDMERSVQPEDVLDDDEDAYESEDEPRKRTGEPLPLEVPACYPPAWCDNMNLVRVSNIMDIEPKPFDPKTYVENDSVVTDDKGRRIRLEDNVVRWRQARSRDGSVSYESNARFVRWSDGSIQLLIGNEVLDISVQEGKHDESHLFLRNKNILQAQGRLAKKMQFMPSSLNSKSHRLLSALVDSRHKKGFKVKNVVTNFDPEKDKEQKEKLAEQRIKSKEDLQRKQEKTMRKFPAVREKEQPQLSSTYLEEALEEEEEEDEEYEDINQHRRYQEQLDAETRGEKRIKQAKRQPGQGSKDRRVAVRTRRDMLEDEPSDGEEDEHQRRRAAAAIVSEGEEGNDKDEEEEGEEEEAAGVAVAEEEEDEDGRREKEEEEEEDVWREGEEDEEEEQQQQEEQDQQQEEEQQHQQHQQQQQDRVSSGRKRREGSPPAKKQAQRRRVVVSDSEED